MATTHPCFYFIRRGTRITGPFNSHKMAELEQRGVLNADTMWSFDKVRWRPLSALPWKNPKAASPAPVARLSPPGAPAPGHRVKTNLDTGSDIPPMSDVTPSPSATLLAETRMETLFPASRDAASIFAPPPCAHGFPAGEIAGAVAAFLWRPDGTFDSIRRRWGSSGAGRAGLMMLGLATGMTTFITYFCIPGIFGNSKMVKPSFVEFGFGVCMPVAIVFVGCMLSRAFLGNRQRKTGVGDDLLLTGGFFWVAVATATALLAVYRIALYCGASPDSALGVIASIVIGIYGVICIVVSMFNGLTEIYGIPRVLACGILTAIGSAASVLVYFLFGILFKP